MRKAQRWRRPDETLPLVRPAGSGARPLPGGREGSGRGPPIERGRRASACPPGRVWSAKTTPSGEWPRRRSRGVGTACSRDRPPPPGRRTSLDTPADMPAASAGGFRRGACTNLFEHPFEHKQISEPV
ncbi:hypothetical protein GCM10010124_18500 [Pilimelia terevasa]|uniref:Uncharacterized protein n=1 Tax=Pilimelia terevasa TaxID=53372 RepID=A0A8J3BMZ5_9ACTN|nr:hypothetical protein GCM10010124_18500 [Pilimelia terevasa]